MGAIRSMGVRGFRGIRRIFGGSMLLLLAGCVAMPVQGPTVREITENAGADIDYFVVPISPQVLHELDKIKPPPSLASFGNAPPAPLRNIEKGDVVNVTIWDAGGGLFSPQGAGVLGTQRTDIPNQVVDAKGRITVPFAGLIRVAGRTTVEAQAAVVKALEHQALQPQAIVNIVDDTSNLFTVVGDVKTPSRMVLDINGTRVLDAVARAGGTTAPAFDMIVQLTRKGVSKRVRLSWVLESPTENIYLQAGDTLYLLKDPETIAVLGATKDNLRIPFDTEIMTLAQAVGLAGGLRDVQAEATGVFVFRYEPVATVAALRPGAKPGIAQGDAMPMIFRANLREPQDYFLAQNFKMQDRDIVYVANAEAVQLGKVLALLRQAAEIYSLTTKPGSIGISGP